VYFLAYKFYGKAKNLKAMVSCAYILDDYAALEKLVGEIPAGSDFLKDVGLKFQSVGLCTEAVASFLKADDPKAAIDACVLLNQWDQAVELAEQHHFQQIEGLLTAYASHLLQKEKLFQAVELYRKANRHTESAKLLVQLAHKAAVSKVQPLRVKKLYVMAALEVDRFKARTLDQAGGVQQSTMQTLQSLLTHDMAMTTSSGSGDGLEEAWHGAEAYHYYLLAQRQLYSGQIEQSMKTSLRLIEYEDILDSKDIYSLIALTSYYNKYYGQCSRAFIKLEGMPIGLGATNNNLSNNIGSNSPLAANAAAAASSSEKEGGITKDDLEKYKQLALSIFIKHPPIDPVTRSIPCPKCQENVYDWCSSCPKCDKVFPACIATGRSLIQVTASELQTCKSCKHKGLERELRKVQHCPLCHALLR
jgi:WD repeat-containing protein 35